MIAPLKVSSNHIATTFLTTSMQLSAKTGVRLGGASCGYREARLGFTGQGTMIYSDELLAAARRIFCFGTPEEALEFPTRFLTYAMTCASDEDIEILKKYFTDDDFKAALDDPAPGIFDQSSWTTWNQRYGRTPVPPLPKRRIPGVDPATVPDFFPPKS